MVPLLLLPLLWGGGSLQQKPGYQYKLQVQETVTVHEGLCVQVPCSFTYPWSSWSYRNLYTYWYRDGDNTISDDPVASSKQYGKVKAETKNRFILANPSSDCSLIITDAKMTDTGCYFFRVERGNCEI
ncbi:unnamed protein product [Pipistrellus nathusii]|uniref:Ig-like domain-containing protein n=1 Tax=Pipistrellus nathusii TaxID=59473 RepID=A0ABN9ZGF5_PIPNA